MITAELTTNCWLVAIDTQRNFYRVVGLQDSCNAIWHT